MKKLAAVLLFFCASCATVPTHVPVPPRDIVQEEKNATVFIYDEEGFCAGVWISPTSVLTANHCESDLGKIVHVVPRQDAMVDPSKDGMPGIVLKTDPIRDLALIAVLDPPTHGIATISKKGPRDGDTVDTVGHPLFQTWTISRGIVSGWRYGTDWHGTSVNRLALSVEISTGNSGGGAFVDGELVGIISYMVSKPDGPFAVPHSGNLAGAVGLPDIKEFLTTP